MISASGGVKARLGSRAIVDRPLIRRGYAAAAANNKAEQHKGSERNMKRSSS